MIGKMLRETRYRGLMIGGIFTIASFVSIFTFIVPIVSVLPGAVYETIAGKFVTNEPYSNVGMATIYLLSGLIAASLIIFFLIIYFKSKNGVKVSNAFIFLMMLCEYFLIHPLGFYLYWKNELNFRGDGQLMFAAVDSFKFSSIWFVIIGLGVDLIKNASEKKA